MTSSRGIVIFAYNSTFDYVKIANVCAKLTKRFVNAGPYLNRQLPVTLITDEFGALQADRDGIDNIIIHSTNEVNERGYISTHGETRKQIHWKNLTRADVYDLTPYDQTLLLDCDYLMFSDTLSNLFDTDIEFTCFRDVHDVTGMNTFQRDSRLSRYSIPMLWATAIYFQKSAFSKSVFDMMKLVKENYRYYSELYGFKSKPFRNDFALSIAYHAVSGYGLDNLIPYSMRAMSSTVDVVDFRDDGTLLYQYKNADKQLCTGRCRNMDLHVMNKEIFTDDIVSKIEAYATFN